METNGSISNSHESQHSDASGSADKEKPSEKVVFINHAEIAWQKRRREWVGDKSQKSQRAQPDISDSNTSDPHICAQIFDTAFQHRSNDYYCRGIGGVGKEKGGSNSSQIHSEMVRLWQEQKARLAAQTAKLAAQTARIIQYQREMDAYNDELIKIQAQQQALSIQWMQDFMMTQSQGLAPPPVPCVLPLPEMPRTPPEEQ